MSTSYVNETMGFVEKAYNETVPENGISFIESERLRRDPTFLLPFVFYEGFLVVVGAVGNILIIGAYVVVKSMRTLPNTFVFSLAISNFMVTSILQPFMMVGALMGEQFILVQRPGLCTVITYVCIQSCMSSSSNIMLVSLNRYICICKNSWYSKIYSKKSVAVMIMAAWFNGFVWNVFLWVGWSEVSFERKQFTCMWNRQKNFSYHVIGLAICAVLVPVSVTAVSYILILLKVKESKKKIQAFNKKDKNQSTSSDIRLARMLFIMFAVYCILCAPYAFITTFDFNDQAPYYWYATFLHMFHTNSAVNFIIYGITNKSFRTGYSLFSKYILIKLSCGAYQPRKMVENDIDKSQMTQTMTIATTAHS
ncbi:unnamed protein product [Owenia fusiformis]|uniref:Uncharacterized protein n=1 Tax=Owenia fusiformis TaxID=6347 RepID=A0A8J1U9G8_OWEFU|nr:unnamed protein product [Owenia fusiformis]